MTPRTNRKNRIVAFLICFVAFYSFNLFAGNLENKLKLRAWKLKNDIGYSVRTSRFQNPIDLSRMNKLGAGKFKSAYSHPDFAGSAFLEMHNLRRYPSAGREGLQESADILREFSSRGLATQQVDGIVWVRNLQENIAAGEAALIPMLKQERFISLEAAVERLSPDEIRALKLQHGSMIRRMERIGFAGDDMHKGNWGVRFSESGPELLLTDPVNKRPATGIVRGVEDFQNQRFPLLVVSRWWDAQNANGRRLWRTRGQALKSLLGLDAYP